MPKIFLFAFPVLITLFAFSLFYIWIAMLIHAISKPIKDKALWIFIILLFSFFGAIVYYYSVHKKFINPINIDGLGQEIPTPSHTTRNILIALGLFLVFIGFGFISTYQKIKQERKNLPLQTNNAIKINTVEQKDNNNQDQIKNEDAWKLYSYEQDGFSVSFMSEPEITEDKFNAAQGLTNLKIIESSIDTNNDSLKYSIEHVTPPLVIFSKNDSDEVKNQKGITFYKNILSSAYGKYISFSSANQLDGKKVESYTIKIPNKTFVGRIVSSNNQVYGYSAECTKCTEIPDLEKFLSSFKLLK